MTVRQGLGVELAAEGAHGVVVTLEPGQAPKVVAAATVAGDATNPQALAALLTRLRQELRAPGPAVLGLPATGAILAGVEPLVVQPQRASLAVQFELQQALPFQVAEAAWHYTWWPGAGPAARVSARPTAREALRRAVVLASRSQTLEARLQACRQAGLPVQAVSSSPAALWNVWAWQRDRAALEAPAALLHVRSAESAEWILHDGTGLQVIPLNAGSALLAEAAETWEGLPGRPAAWLLGGAELCRPFQDALAARRAAVQWFDPSRWLAGASAAVIARGPMLPALGLALQAAQAPVALPLNLLAWQQSRGQQQRRARVTNGLTGLLLVLALWHAAAGMWARQRAQAGLLARLQEQERLYQALRPEAKALLQRQQDLEAQSAALEAVLAQKTQLPLLAADIVAALPDDVWLTSLQLTKRPAPGGLLEGRAASFPQVTEFFERLKRQGRFTTVKPLATNVAPDPASGKEVVTFSVQVQRGEPAT